MLDKWIRTLTCVLALFVLPLANGRGEEKSPTAKSGHRVLAADKGHIAIVSAEGKTEWEFENRAEVHDLWQLKSGNILLPAARDRIIEITPEKEIVWEYKALPTPANKKHVEIHAFQPLDDGRVMVAESGNGRIVEVNRNGMIEKVLTLTLENPDPHRDTRMARKLSNGNYLVCHEGDGKIREYSGDGKVIWTYAMELGGRPRTPGHGPEGHGLEVYGAVRLKNGNTLIAGGNNNRVLEVNSDGKTVWSIDQKELPGITLAWVTSLHVLPSGNIIIGNCHAGEDNPQLFEVTPEKKVVWRFKDFKTFGNGLASSHILDLPDGTIR